jgi:hypothetical protein
MSNETTHGNESIEPRTERALSEVLTVLPDQPEVAGAPEMYLVVSESGSEYTVDRRDGSCTCPDALHRGARCKHLRRVAFATGERPLPVGVDGVDPSLGEHTNTSPRVVAADGGILEAPDDGVILDEDDGEDCACSELPDGVPCWPCYRDGAAFND